MVKSIYALVLFLASNVFFGQATFDKLESNDNIKSVIVNQKMFQMMAMVKVDASDKETQQYMSLIKKLELLKVFTTKNPQASSEMKLASSSYIKTAGLVDFLQKKEAGKNLNIYIKSGSNKEQIKELVLFLESSTPETETVLMALTGNFTMNDLALLTKKLNIPVGLEALKLIKN